MKTNEFIYARTHAEFLNSLLGTHYKAWMKSGISTPDGKWLWMIRLDRSVSAAGWKNYMEGVDKIIEEHVDHEYVYESHGTYIDSNKRPEDRVVFDIVEGGSFRKYVFRGVFRLNKRECTFNKNVWEKIEDTYCF